MKTKLKENSKFILKIFPQPCSNLVTLISNYQLRNSAPIVYPILQSFLSTYLKIPQSLPKSMKIYDNITKHSMPQFLINKLSQTINNTGSSATGICILLALGWLDLTLLIALPAQMANALKGHQVVTHTLTCHCPMMDACTSITSNLQHRVL